MSGPFAFAAAAKIPGRIKAVASIRGIRLHTDDSDSPHLDADKIGGEMYFACAEEDHHITHESIDSLDAYLKTININYRIEFYPKTEHGFYYPLWERLFAILKRAL
jgi:carboxymethylenebutenolidase